MAELSEISCLAVNLTEVQKSLHRNQQEVKKNTNENSLPRSTGLLSLLQIT